MKAGQIHTYMALEDLQSLTETDLRLIKHSSQKIWVAYHILSNMTTVNFHTYMALEDLQSLTETDLTLIRHSLQINLSGVPYFEEYGTR